MQNHCIDSKCAVGSKAERLLTRLNSTKRLLSADLSLRSKHKSLRDAGMLQLNKRNTAVFFFFFFFCFCFFLVCRPHLRSRVYKCREQSVRDPRCRGCRLNKHHRVERLKASPSLSRSVSLMVSHFSLTSRCFSHWFCLGVSVRRPVCLTCSSSKITFSVASNEERVV